MRKLSFLVIFLMMIIMIGCSSFERRIYDVYGRVYSSGNVFLDNFTGIVDSYEDWRNLQYSEEYQFLLEHYSENFFENYAVAIINISHEKGLDDAEVMEVCIENKTLNVYINHEYSETDFSNVTMVTLPKEEASKIKNINCYYNKYEYVYITLSLPPSGCEIFETRDYVRKGYEYDFTNAKKFLRADKFIDLNTLEIYKDSIVVNKNTYLLAYDNKLDSDYIQGYVFNNNDFEYEPTCYDLLELDDYETIENGDLVIKKDDVTYFFTKSKYFDKKVFLSKIISNHKLFDSSLEEIKRKLMILYGSDDYTSHSISIVLEEDGFIINLKESYPYLYG